MKSFFLATFAALAAANGHLQNEVSIASDVAITNPSTGAELAKVTEIASGWKMNGSGADATLDLNLWFNFAKGSTNYVNSSKSVHFLAIANEDDTEYETQKFSYAEGSTATQVTMAYMNVSAALPSGDAGNLSANNFTGAGSFKAVLEAESLKFSENIQPAADFWNLDPTTSANNDTAYWLGLTRTNGGVAGITTGVTRKMRWETYTTGSTGLVKLLGADIDASWAAEPVDNSEDDGATGMTTFAVATVAAIAALMF